MKTRTLQILSILIIFTAVATQDLLGNITSKIPSNISPSAIKEGLKDAIKSINGTNGNLTSLIPSGNFSNITPSALIAKSKEILDNFKKGAIKTKLPTDIDFTKIDEIDKILNDLNEENFDFDSKEMIPNIKEISANSTCVKRLENVFEYMSMAEQVAFYSAYQAKQKENSADNTGRCFAPRTLHKVFKKINRGNMKAMNKKMTADSKELRNSFRCVGESFRKLKIKGDYKPEIEGFLNVQSTSNQCKSSFMRILTQTLGSRRRYLLLNNKDSEATAIKDANGNFVGFSWLESEVEIITKSFLKFAECYQGLPESVTKTYANVLNKLSEDPACQNSEESRRLRLLQGDLLKDGLKNAIPSGKLADAIKGGLDKLPSDVKASISGKVTNAIKNATAGLPSGIKEAISGKIDEAVKNGLDKLPSNSTIKEGIEKAKGEVKKFIKKQKSIGNINFNEESKKELQTLSDNLEKKSGDYSVVGELVGGFITEEGLKSKCNMPGLMKGLLQEESKDLYLVMQTEMNKMEKNEACTDDYIVYINKPKGGQDGKVTCTNADANCKNISFKYKANYNDSSMTMVSTCSNSKRHIFGYYDSSLFGKALDYVSNTFETCKKGQSNKCAKEFSKMKKNPKNPKRYLQEGEECVPKMKADCEEVISERCEESKLFENIEELVPSQSDSALPKECQKIDTKNPNYVDCFTWINKNLIAYTIFPELGKIEDLQELINESQTARLRLLQNTQIKIVKTDASSTDTVAQIPASETELSSADVVIDGTTSEKTKVSDVEEVENSTPTPTSKDASKSASFNKFGYVLISLLIVLIA